MAPGKARRAQTQKKKAVVFQTEKPNPFISSRVVRESKRSSKVTCFFDESLLTCDICLEVMHNAMNVSPCNHKFCAGCIYEWNSLNTKCPKCRWSAVDITRDPTINAIIEQYLVAFPEKRRDASQLIELDERELDHLEKWERRRDSDDGDYDYDDMNNTFYESEDSDAFEVQEEQLDGDDDDDTAMDEYSSSEQWSDDEDMVTGSFEENDEEDDSEIQEEYISRRNLEKARMERLRREKEERERLKQMEAERNRRTNSTTKKGRNHDHRCGVAVNGRNGGTRGRSNAASNPQPAPSHSITTRSMSRLRGL